MRAIPPRYRLPANILLLILIVVVNTGCVHVSAAPEEPLQTATSRVTAVPVPSKTIQPTNTMTIARTDTPSPTSTAEPSRTPTPVVANTARVVAPILMYHHVSDQGSTPYITSVSAFRAQMQALHDRGFETVSVSTLADAIHGEGQLPEKAVVITFDDGYLDVYENAFPIMREFGFTGVAYIITSTFEKSKSYGYMQVEQLQDLLDAGWEIGSHSSNHVSLKTTPSGFRNEVEGSKKLLEEKLGVPVRTFSYPFADANEWIEQQVEEYGYESAVGVGTFVSYTPKQLYFLSRRDVYRGIVLKDFLALLTPTEAELATPAP